MNEEDVLEVKVIMAVLAAVSVKMSVVLVFSRELLRRKRAMQLLIINVEKSIFYRSQYCRLLNWFLLIKKDVPVAVSAVVRLPVLESTRKMFILGTEALLKADVSCRSVRVPVYQSMRLA